MASPRETRMIIVTGRKRIGKSNETLRQLYRFYTQGANARKALIIDPNNEYGAYELHESGIGKTIVRVPLLGHDDILKFNRQKFIEIRRIVPIDKYGYPLAPEQTDELILKTLTEFRSGCLFIEDLNTIFGDSLPKRVSGFFSNNAHRDCDIVLQMQSVGRVLPKMYQNAQFFRFHQQLDSIDNSKNKLQEDYEIFKIAEHLVGFQYNSGNIRYFIWVDKEDKKIRGNYTSNMFAHACMSYLSENDKIVNKEYNKKDLLSNNRKYSTQLDAIIYLIERLFNEYSIIPFDKRPFVDAARQRLESKSKKRSVIDSGKNDILMLGE